ncbi:MAG: indole-3-glycerol phosphate synthase TrpC [bacterium]
MPLDTLSEILARKTERLVRAQADRPLKSLREQALAVRADVEPHRLNKVLNRNQINIIAEYKRKSPSKGVIREDMTASAMAGLYETGGAAAISVLTEEDYFAGSLNDLLSVRTAVECPILRKDFVVSDYQVYETAVAGADALLLIVAALADDALVRLRRITEEELGLDALVEVHTESEMKRAVASGARLIGVNNRDLKTFEVSLDTSVKLAGSASPNTVLVSESGLKSAEDLRRLNALGYKGFLIGEALMRAERPEEALRALMDKE